jgi:hypothetical protein
MNKNQKIIHSVFEMVHKILLIFCSMISKIGSTLLFSFFSFYVLLEKTDRLPFLLQVADYLLGNISFYAIIIVEFIFIVTLVIFLFLEHNWRKEIENEKEEFKFQNEVLELKEQYLKLQIELTEEKK